MTDLDLLAFSKQACDDVVALAQENDDDHGWEVFIEENGVRGTKKENGQTRYWYRGVGRIPLPPWLVANYLADPETPSTDEQFDRFEVIRNLGAESEHTTLEHSFYKGVFPTDPRDFVYVSRVEQRGPVCILAWASPPDPPHAFPETKKYVRGRVSSGSGWVLRPVPRGREGGHRDDEMETEATYVVDVDPGGYIPAWLSNQVSKSEPMQVAELRMKLENEKSEGVGIEGPCRP